MTTPNDELEHREIAALAAMKKEIGSETDQCGATLFVSHHLEELGEDYWLKHCAATQPEPRQVLDILVLRSNWSDDEGFDILDFSLPGNVTDYVISVSFDPNGNISGITMES